MDEQFLGDDADGDAHAQVMINVHGTEAAAVARGNARGAALAGQAAQAKAWIKVLGIIQRRLAAPKAPHLRRPDRLAETV
jgi:hypothetical protein